MQVDGPVWMEESYDTIIRHSEDLVDCRKYINGNGKNTPAASFTLHAPHALAVCSGQAGSLSAETGETPVLPPAMLKRAKKLGFSDRQLAKAFGTTEDKIRAERKKFGVVPTYRLVDTCAAEFEAYTP
ncbi:MAG: hypothetical protein KGQ89_02020, partial [Verrucomicrobia bacterium]|nr:hypothetical protein [Verrucomicrobiota bacterium]